MKTTTAITDTPRDHWSVLAALDHPDLKKPSLVDIAGAIQAIENAGYGGAATLAWLLSRSPETLAICRELRKHAADAKTLCLRGNGVLLGAMTDRDLACLIDASDEVWRNPEEVIPTGLAPVQLEAMVRARIAREDDADERGRLETVLVKLAQYKEREERH